MQDIGDGAMFLGALRTGKVVPSTTAPSTVTSRTPVLTPSGLVTLMWNVDPRNRRVTSKPSQEVGMHGSMRSPS